MEAKEVRNMDGFEDNPFADPAQINPFADPSVAAATEPPSSTEEYNPFAEQEGPKEPEVPRLPPPTSKAKDTKKQKPKPKPSGPQRPPASNPEPAILPTDPPPDYEPAPAQFSKQSPGAASDLEKREAEVARREAKLKEREKNLATLGTDARPRNFPPLPKFCPCQPCFYINISEEIPPGERFKMRIVVVALFGYTFLLLLNLILSAPGAYYAINDGDDKTDVSATQGIVTVVFAIIFLFMDPVLALLCWFMPLYYAYRKDSALAFMWFFFVMVMQNIIWLLFALGPPGFSCGVIGGILLLGASSVVGAMWIVFGLLWLALVILGSFLIFIVHRYYRSSGHTLQAAGTEAAQVAASNKAVRTAVKQSVKAGVSATLSTPNE